MKKLFLILILFYLNNLYSNDLKPNDEVLVFSKSGLVLREKPDKKSKNLYLIPDGTRLKIISKVERSFEVIENLSGFWWKVKFQNLKGFIFSGFALKLSGNFKGTVKTDFIRKAISSELNRHEKVDSIRAEELFIQDNLAILRLYHKCEESEMSYTSATFLYLIQKDKFQLLREFEERVMGMYIQDFNDDGKVDILLEEGRRIRTGYVLYLQHKNKSNQFQLVSEVSDFSLVVSKLGKCNQLILKNHPDYITEDNKPETYYFDCDENKFLKLEEKN